MEHVTELRVQETDSPTEKNSQRFIAGTGGVSGGGLSYLRLLQGFLHLPAEQLVLDAGCWKGRDPRFNTASQLLALLIHRKGVSCLSRAEWREES